MQLLKILTFTILLLTGSFLANSQTLNANFTSNTSNGCPPTVVQFTDASTGGPVSWSWNFGNGNTSVLQSPSTTYNLPGIFTVTLTITNAANQTSVKTGTITINNPPVVSISTSTPTGCPGYTSAFTSQITWNTTNGGSVLWNFGDGSTSTSPTPTHVYANPGYYNVTMLAVNSAGCSTVVSQPSMIQVWSRPSTSFNASPPNLCSLSATTTFNPSISGFGPFTYLWDFGDGNSSTASNPTHGYANYGSYNIKLVVTDGHGCKDTLIRPGHVKVSTVVPQISAPATVCVGQMTAFQNNTQQLVNTVSWNMGNGATGSGNVFNYAYPVVGTYTITMTVSNGICTETTTQSVTVTPKPNLSFSSSPLQPCPAPATITFSNNTTGATSYTWFFGNLGQSTSTAQNPTFTYTQNGSYTVKLIATTAQGCRDSLIVPSAVQIFDLDIKINNPVLQGCVPLLINFDGDMQGYPYAVSTFYWDFGDGTTSNIQYPTKTYAVPGVYQVTFAVLTANGCKDTVRATVRCGTPPVANFAASPLIVCVKSGVAFSDSSSSNVTNWFWNFGDGMTDTSVNPNHPYQNPGIYTVKLTVSDRGCKDTLSRVNYITVNLPKSRFYQTFSCDTPGFVRFSDSSIGATSYLWSFGDGTTSTAQSPSHLYATSGYYLVVQQVHNSTTGCYDTTSSLINILRLNSTIYANDTTLCQKDTTTLHSTTTGGIPANIRWIVNSSGYPDAPPSITVPFFQRGYNTVTLITRDEHNCFDTTVRTNYVVVGQPDAYFTATPRQGCAPVNVTFTDTSLYPPGTNGASRNWFFGDGTSATVTPGSTNHLYTAAGFYTITLIATDQIGCKDTLVDSAYIDVHKPRADFVLPTNSACVGKPFTFLNTSVGVQMTHLWYFGDGTTSTNPSPSHSYAAAGPYTVKLVISDNFGCKDSITKLNVLTVSPSPTAAFRMSDTFKICPPLLVQFTNQTVSGVSYSWSFGDGNSSTLTNPGNTFLTSGVYRVRLVATNAIGCTDTVYHTVRILGYDGLMSYSPLEGCAPLTVNFNTNVTNVPAFVYDFADGTTLPSTSSQVSHTYTTPGAYVPRVILTDNLGCSATSFGLDTIKVDGVNAGFTYSPNPICDSGLVTFLDTSRGGYTPITNRRWEFQGGATSTVVSPTHYYARPGSYSVILYNETVSGCKDTFFSTIVIGATPTINAGPDTVICANDTAMLFPTGGVSYRWTPAATLVCPTCANPGPHPSVTTRYVVVGTNAERCFNTDSITIKTKTHTIGIFPIDTASCDGTPVLLEAGGGTKYTWLPATGLSNPRGAITTATPKTTTTYTIVVQEAGCIPDTGRVKLVIYRKPEVNAGPDQTIVAGSTATIVSTGSPFINSYTWQPAETLDCPTCTTVEATPPVTTEYTVLVTTKNGCSDTDKVKIFVLCQGSQIFIPNTFTPNGNGTNDRFFPRGKGITNILFFQIFNRWGELVFEKRNISINDEMEGWDGKYKGELMNADVFVYRMEAECTTGEKLTYKGDVTLIR